MYLKNYMCKNAYSSTGGNTSKLKNIPNIHHD